MSSTPSEYTSLTDSPQNLKESIDWILRVSGKDGGKGGSWGMSELLTLILKFFSKPDQKLIEAVKKSFKEAVEQVTKDLEDKLKGANGTISEHFRKFSNVAAVRNTIHVDFGNWLDTLRGWMEKGCNPICEADGPMTNFVDGLAVFMGYKNGVLNDDGFAKKYRYVSAYDASNARWENLKEDQKKECALIFLNVVITCFSLLSYLYWNGRRGKKKSEDGVWADERLCNSGSELSKFMKAVGFNDFNQIHTVYTKILCPKSGHLGESSVKKCVTDPSMKGSTMSGRLQTAFAEFGRVMSEDNPPKSYGDFLAALITCAQCDASCYQLSENAIVCGKLCETSDPSKFPFTKLFIVSNAYRIVIQSSSITKTVLASAATVAGVGVGAYLTYLSGILSALGVL